MDDISVLWRNVTAQLKKKLGPATFQDWFRDVTCEAQGDAGITLWVPSDFVYHWIETYYAELLHEVFAQEGAAQKELFLGVRDIKGGRQAQDLSVVTQHQAPLTNNEEGNLADKFASPLDERLTFESFYVGPSNHFAYEAARRVAQASEAVFNPVMFYGGVGLGKTHLMHAMAHHIQARHPGRRVVYLSAERFTQAFISSVRNKETLLFKGAFQNVDVLMIDDIQFIGGKVSTQQELLSIFNYLLDHNRQIVLSADRAPAELRDLDPRMRSRLSAGLVADIKLPTHEMICAIIQDKADRLGVQVAQDVLAFVARSSEATIREAEGALNRLIAYSHFMQRPLTLEVAQEVLKDVICPAPSSNNISVEAVKKAVAEHYGISIEDLCSMRRQQKVVRARHIAMFLAKQLTPVSLPGIGQAFGGRDHTSVLHAVKKITAQQKEDNLLQQDLRALHQVIKAC